MPPRSSVTMTKHINFLDLDIMKWKLATTTQTIVWKGVEDIKQEKLRVKDAFDLKTMPSDLQMYNEYGYHYNMILKCYQTTCCQLEPGD